MSQDQFEKFKELLLQNFQFPCIYTHKIIGSNSVIFKSSISDFEAKFIGLTKSSQRLSASGKHLAITYEYHAASADDVIQLMIETRKLNDLIYII
jgi:putative lipoic acid-binding regulatory protein